MTALQKQQIDKNFTRAAFVASTVDAEKRTADLTWSTGSQVRRTDWWTDDTWIEELSLDQAHVRLERLNNGAPLLADHDAYTIRDVIGVVERAWIVNGEGRATVRFSDKPAADEIFSEVKSGILRNISIGYRVYKLEEQKDKVDNLRVLRAIDWEPMEISLVTIPADASAQIRSDSSKNAVSILLTSEEKSMENDAETQTEQRIDNGVDVVKPDLDAVRAEAAKAERKRQTDIRDFARFAGDRIKPEMVDEFIKRGISYADAKEKILEIWSKQADAETVRTDASVTVDERDKFIEQGVKALCARAGFEPHDGANSLRGMRLTEIAKTCLSRSGVKYEGMDERQMVGRAFTQTTSDFPILLENAMNKTLLGAYAKSQLIWQRIARKGSVPDFRANPRYRTGSFGNLQPINEAGEFKNTFIPDGEKSSVTIGTKGNIINLTRQMIINDDLGAFIGLANDLGWSAGRTIDVDLMALIASNPTMTDGIALFHASHGNLAGTGAAPSVATFDAGRVAIGSQKDISGNDVLDLSPAIFLGGLARRMTASNLNSANYDPDTSNKLQAPNGVQGMLTDIVTTARITGTEWYLLTDPNMAPSFEVAFLNGDENPFLDQEVGFDVDGTRYKVRLDYGVAAVDWRGAYKNPGA